MTQQTLEFLNQRGLRRKKIALVINLFGWAVALGFLVMSWQRLGNRDEWERILAGLDWGYFWLAVAVLFVGHIGRTQIGYFSTRYLGYPIGVVRAYRYWCLSQIAKYLPGGVWLFAAKAVLYHRRGMPVLLASAAITWELSAVLAVGLLFGVVGIAAFPDPNWRILIPSTALIIIVGLLVSLTELPWRILRRLRLGTAERMLTILRELGNKRFSLLGQLSILSFVAWLLTGVGFYLLLVAAGYGAVVDWWYATVSYAVAWTVGFLVFFTPAGLGPREAMLTLLLTPFIGASQAFSIALLARLWWALVEGLHIAVALLWYSTVTLRQRALHIVPDA